ncbi:hypothetical protein [Streptomyces sp. NPDC052192]|uniref:hypothetical protein n=1 Tax=Streptomyces sp. NPDC052192 TaxID=3155052 RepID=UPI003433B9C3
MFVFVCAGCGAELTVPLSQVVLPAHAHQQYGNGLQLPVLMAPGTFAVDPEPWGPPWREGNDVDPDEARARGIHAPVDILSDGVTGAIAVAPGDVRGTELIPARGGGFCCGIGGSDGPNMDCVGCGLPVATRIDDCSSWQTVWLDPDAVRRLPVAGPDSAPLSWAELMTEWDGTPPCVPITTGWRSGSAGWWSWNPQWEAAAGPVLVQLLAASAGYPVTVPRGLAEAVFQRALDVLLPDGSPERTAVIAGPGCPDPDVDAAILLVPVHPQTGEVWAPNSPTASACPVPLPFGIWRWLAFPEAHLPVPASGTMPTGVLRDDPAAPVPDRFFRIDPTTFRNALARLPDVRTPWLREIHGDRALQTRAHIF